MRLQVQFLLQGKAGQSAEHVSGGPPGLQVI